MREGGEERGRELTARLTWQQVEIMESLRAGEKLHSIAIRLGVTISTVATQQRRAQEKLGARDRGSALTKWSRCRKSYLTRTT